MRTHDFHEPIFIWVDRDDPARGAQRIDCVEDAIAALFRADISAYGNARDGRGHAVWMAAVHHLASAKADGDGAGVLAAYGAMRQLAHAVGILATPDGALLATANGRDRRSDGHA